MYTRIISRRSISIGSTATAVLSPRCIFAKTNLWPEGRSTSSIRSAALRIDVHAHYFPQKYLDRLDGYGGTQSTLHIRKNKLVAGGSLDVVDPICCLEDRCTRALFPAEVSRSARRLRRYSVHVAYSQKQTCGRRFARRRRSDLLP